MANKVYTTMSEESIRYLCGLINKIVSLPTDIISNINLADNLTFSNIHIKNLIDKCLQDAKDHSEAIVNSLTHLVAEKIDFEPTLDNTTNKINTLLLYSKNSDNNYTQYLRLANELLNLGDTSLSLTDYLKITEAASTYTKLTDFKTLSDEVSGIKTKIGSDSLDTTSDTLVGAINEVANKSTIVSLTKAEYDALATKDPETYYIITDDEQSVSITPSISSSSTNSEVPTALAVEKRVKNMLVCPNDKSPKEFALENCKNGQVVEFVQWGGSHVDSVSAYATYRMIRGTDPNWSVLVATIYDTDHRRTIKYCPYDGYRDDANKWKAWQRVVTTTVDDVPNTNITFSDETKYSIVNNTCMYFVKNGTCTVHLYVTCNASVGAWATVSSGLPKPSEFPSYGALSNPTGDKFLNYVINSSGVLQLKNGVNGISYIGTFSYPVAES